MKTRVLQVRKNSVATQPWWVTPAACLATLLALPVSAGITIPDEPLTTGNKVAPNILFILDDSGSMAWRNMNSQDISQITGSGNFKDGPDQDGIKTGTSISSESTGNSAMYEQNYVTNSLYYNPTVTYQPWMGASGNRLSGGTGFTSAYSSDNYVSNDGNGSSGGSRNLSDKTQTFYAPKDTTKSGVAYLSSVDNYYRYQILAGTDVILRGVYGQVVASSGNLGVSPSSGTVYFQDTNTHAVSGYAAGDALEVFIKSPSSSRSVLYWMYGPDTALICSGQVNAGQTNSCTVNSAKSGGYTVIAKRWNNTKSDADYNLWGTWSRTNSCDGLSAGSWGWIDCTPATPTGRSVADEKQNFATWYSFHRTRIKAAKAGAAEAFRPLGNKVRVGYRSLHQNGSTNFDIPVSDGNDGRFVDNVTPATTSRTTWYRRLFAASANSGTPLRSVLENAGKYFEDASSSGPYGPESGSNQYSCRQNFSILTTDGYWNGAGSSVGNADNTAGSKITGSKGETYQYSPVAPYAGADSNTLADVAMYYWKNDLRDLSNNVPTTDADPAFWQHMVTFGISIGLKTSMGWSSVDDVPANPTWPQPGDDRAANVDDLLHAALNGRGSFVSASNPKEFTSGLAKALAAIAQRTSSFSNVATNAASIKTGGKVFNASYVSGLWTGAVKAWTLDANSEPSVLAWSATVPAPASRKVFTFNGASGDTFPTSSQVSSLARPGGPVDYPVTGAENAAYIKGDGALEERNGGLLRNRASTVLGDIVNSSPAYVEDTKTLYVGANDGMLHAFNADTGVEQFAYVPGLVNLGDLSQLSRGDYTHKWFVDGPVVVTNRKLTPNKNYLVGAMGRGGKGLFGLDVTDPASFGTGNVTWELGGSDADMGLVTGRPILARVGGGTVAAIVGNGVNSTDNKAVLYVINAATGAIIKKLDTGAGSAAAPNGLSAPTGILGKDGRTLAYAYAGDRLGNVWKFDMSAASPASWTVSKMFTAKSAGGTGAVQPITGGVTVATDPRTYKRWVFFGTGSYMTTTEADDKTPNMQGMYGIVDTGSTVTYTKLKKRAIGNTGATQDGYPVRTFEAKADLDLATYDGWYLDLPGKGERIVQDAQLVSNILVTASMIPEGDACEASGSGYINALDAFTGTSAGKSFFDLDKDGDTTDQSIGGVPVGSVNFGVGMPTLPIFLDGKLIVGGTNAGEKPGSGGIVGKVWSPVSWREIRKD
ncbi:PilC/PilY family type IV pilus protein [Thermomonas sp. LB-4]|uniref:pilus assembly protein n=1 Tax=Thermomonas sp. LB-4 TaxID=3102790 RepID=UPI002ED7C74E